jgi:tRNA A-37 threonylcarbamoyl transferase component Bud32
MFVSGRAHDGGMTDERGYCDLDTGGIHWLQTADCPEARALVDSPAKLKCRILRRAPRRFVSYAPGVPALLIKQYLHRGPIDFIKTLVRGAPALREWRALREAENRRLPVPKPLALGRRERQSLLVTEFIESAVTLEDYAKAAPAIGVKRRIIREIALLIRRMHDAGVYQRDLHLGNLLLRQGDSKREYFLLDLQRIDIDPMRGFAKRWRDLAALAGGCAYAGRSDRRYFFNSYLSVTPRLPVDEAHLGSEIERRARFHRLHLWQSREKRCLAENREYAKVSAGDFRGFARRSEWSGALKDLLTDPRRMLEQAAIVKDSRTTTVGRVTLANQQVFVKRYNAQGPFYAFKNLFRASRAKRGWKAGNSLFMRGIGVALPLAYLERRRFRILRESYLLTAAVNGSELSQLAKRQSSDFRAKRLLLGQLARQVRRMHDRGVANRDLKADNIIAQDRGRGRYDFFIVDFDGISSGMVSSRVRARNLARLVRAVDVLVPLTSSDRLRLVNGYLGARGSALWRKIYRDMRRVEKKLPYGAPREGLGQRG